jgi:DNA-binding transcriptional regulator YhcF (GntR family)
MGRRAPAVEQGVSFLRSLLPRLQKQGKADLPSVLELSAMAGVSYVTMWRALRVMRDRGVIAVRPRHGASVIPGCLPQRLAEDADAGLPAAPLQKWQELARDLERDVLRGVYPPGTLLPSAKALRWEYGACHQTLRKALSTLTQREIVERRRRGFRTPSLSGGSSRARIVLIARGDESGGDIWHGRPRVDEHLRNLEQGCSRAGVGLTFAPFVFGSGKRYAAPEHGPDHDAVVGYAIFATSIPEPNLAELVSSIARRNKPVAILNESGDMRLPALSAQTGRVKLFSMAITPACGFAVGKYLLGLGHRRAAYFSPSPEDVAHKRLQGLVAAFAAAGLPDAVCPFAIAPATPLSPDFPPPVRSAIDALVKRVLPHTGRHGALYERTAGALSTQMSTTIWYESVADSLVPWFDRALAIAGTTAWVGFNDRLALHALDYLRYRKRKVPGDISVVGFDDSPEALAQKLTSYNFNSAAVVHAMMTHLLAPGRKLPGTAPIEPVEIPGYVVERLSTSRPSVPT